MGEALTVQPPHRDTSDLVAELTNNVSETAGMLFATRTVVGTLEQVVELAVTTIEGCDAAGLSLTEQGVVTKPVRTDPIVLEFDALQQIAGEGPCVDAVAQRIMVYAEDLAEDHRWPHFASQAISAGLRSVLVLPVVAEHGLGTLNLYARQPATFGTIERAKGAILAGLAGLAISVAQSHEDEERRTENIRAALATREVIGQAQGILMERDRLSSSQAFEALRVASQHLQRKLRDVAQDLVDTGEWPEGGGPPRP